MHRLFIKHAITKDLHWLSSVPTEDTSLVGTILCLGWVILCIRSLMKATSFKFRIQIRLTSKLLRQNQPCSLRHHSDAWWDLRKKKKRLNKTTQSTHQLLEKQTSATCLLLTKIFQAATPCLATSTNCQRDWAWKIQKHGFQAKKKTGK